VSKTSSKPSGATAARARTARLYGRNREWLKITTGRKVQWYRVALMEPEESFGKWAVRLFVVGSATSEKYDIVGTPHGLECSCPSFNWKHRNTEDGCKHVEALKVTEYLRKAK
jgi:predicted nucleic acid-binding Zn finger protein